MENFNKLIAPIKADDFFNTYWRNKPLLITKDNDFEHLITLEEINEYLGKPSLTYPLVRLVGNGKEIDFEHYKLKRVNTTFNFINKDLLFKNLNDGNTLVIQASQLQFPNLFKFTQHLEEELNMDVNANIYITPSNSKGFFPHVDTHEVIACQVYGAKNWNIYDIPYMAPIGGFNLTIEESQNYLKSEPSHKIKLEPGDLIYIPRGVVHDAFSDGEYSVHITFGFTTLLNLDILQQVVKDAEKSIFFREPYKMPNQEISGAEQDIIIENVSLLIKDALKKLQTEKVANPKYIDTTDLFYKIYFIENLQELDELKNVKLTIRKSKKQGLNKYQNALLNSIESDAVFEENNAADFPTIKAGLKMLLIQNCIDISSLIEE